MSPHRPTFIGDSLPLPPELISLTFHFLKNTADPSTLYCLVQCSKALYQELIPALYRNITLDKRNAPKFLQGLGKVDEESLFGIYDTHNNSPKRYFVRSHNQKSYLHMKPLRRKLTLLSHVESLVLEDLHGVKTITGVIYRYQRLSSIYEHTNAIFPSLREISLGAKAVRGMGRIARNAHKNNVRCRSKISKRIKEDSKAWCEIIFTSLKNGLSPRVLRLQSPAWADPIKNLAHTDVDEPVDMDRIQRDLMGLVSWIVEGHWTLERLVLEGAVGIEYLPSLYYYQSHNDGTTNQHEDEDVEQKSTRCSRKYEIHYASPREIEETIGQIRFRRCRTQDEDPSETMVLTRHNLWEERKRTLECWLKEYELDVVAGLPLPHQPERPEGRKLKATVKILSAGDMFGSTAGWEEWLEEVIEDEEIRHDLEEKIVFC